MTQIPNIPNLFPVILDSIKDSVIVTTKNGSIYYANKATTTLFNYSGEEIIGRNIDILIPEHKIYQYLQLVERLLWGEPIEDHETERLKKDNQSFSVSLSLSTLKDADGNVVGIVSLMSDITLIKKSEKKFQSLLESAPDAMIITNQLGLIVLVNVQTEKMFGFERRELLGHELEILMPVRYRKIHVIQRDSYMRQPLVREMGTGLELYGTRKDGTEFPVEISLSPLHTDEGTLILSAIRDVTVQKRAAMELKDYASKLEISNKELEQFAYVASHDLQEPLRNITNFATLLKNDAEEKLSGESLYFLKVITDSTERMKTLIAELLDFSRIGRNSTYTRVDCNKVMEEVLSDISLAIKDNKAKINVAKLPVILASETEIKILFQNLLTNAIKFRKSGESPEISVWAQENDVEWKFFVKDNGIGIKQEHLGKIFLIFQRLHSQTEYPGTGIGLATCNKIIDLYEGEFTVDSEPGKGSTFSFTIPKKRKEN